MNIKKRFLIPLAISIFSVGTTFLTSAVIFSTPAIAASKLGNLSKFKKVVKDTEELIQKGDLAGAKIRIKDLETTWDEAEPALKPRSAADWHKIDKGIDHVLSALRDEPQNPDTCKSTIADLLKIINQQEGN
jgi:hypothetical protein